MTLNQIDQGYEARFDGESSGARTIEPAFTQDLWERAVGRLKGAFDSQVFGAYLKPLRFSSFDGSKNEIRILAPSNLVKNHVQQNYAARILNALREESQREFEVKIEVADAGNTISGNTAGGEKGSVIPPVVVVKKPSSSFVSGLQSGRARQAKPSASPSFFRPGEATGLNPKYTFENFIVGNSNQFCHAAAMRVAERPGHSYNPLFIYGGVGLGKTHILHAIGNSVHARIPKARIAYMSSETFTNELIQSLRNAKMDEFKQRMRSLDVLLIDDIQFMCGKERTQEEFFHTFNTLYDAKCQIVLTSDKIPQDIPGIEERLQTRFSWGLTADLQAPDFETRVAILRRKASLDGFSLPEEVSQTIAERFSSNVRELEGALTRLHAASSLHKAEINKDFALAVLKPLLQPKSVNLSIDDIKRAVGMHFNIKISDMISKRRTKNLSFPRHIAMYLCRKHTTASYPEIGAHFGGRDHSSVIHAAEVVKAKIGANDQVREIVGEIEKKLLG